MIPHTCSQDITFHDPDAIATPGVFRGSFDEFSSDKIDKLRESSLKSKGKRISGTKKHGQRESDRCRVGVPLWLLRQISDSAQSHDEQSKDDDEPSLLSSDVSEESSSCHSSATNSRRVRFQVENGSDKVQVLGPLLKPSSEMSAQEKEAVYWNRSDYVEFKKNITTVFADAFQGCEVLPGSYSMTLKKTYQACCSTKRQSRPDAVISPRIQSDLEEWTRAAQSRRGLESLSVPFIADARRKSKASVIKPLVQLQSKMDDGMFDQDMKAEILRNYSRRRSRSAALFARVLAQADEAALCKPFKTGVAHRRFTAV